MIKPRIEKVGLVCIDDTRSLVAFRFFLPGNMAEFYAFCSGLQDYGAGVVIGYKSMFVIV